MIGKLGMSGSVEFEVIRPAVKKAPLSWRLRNWFTWMFITSWFWTQVFIPIARFLKAPMVMMYGELSIRVRKGDTGEWIDYGVVSRRVITDAGVTFLRDDWNSGANDINLMNFHGIGTGVTAESAAQTALITESTTALNPNNTRASGTRSVPASNQYRSVGTLTADADIAVTEHGFFDQSATGGGTMWDRSVFAAINLVGANPDSIQCTYTVTLASGG